MMRNRVRVARSNIREVVGAAGIDECREFSIPVIVWEGQECTAFHAIGADVHLTIDLPQDIPAVAEAAETVALEVGGVAFQRGETVHCVVPPQIAPDVFMVLAAANRIHSWVCENAFGAPYREVRDIIQSTGPSYGAAVALRGLVGRDLVGRAKDWADWTYREVGRPESDAVELEFTGKELGTHKVIVPPEYKVRGARKG